MTTVASSVADTDMRAGGGQSLISNFALASLVVIVGVLASWVAVKRAGDVGAQVTADLTLDDLPTTVLANRGSAGAVTLVERGDLAFAAGRVVEPRFDNALYFYRQALEQNGADALASAGMERVLAWLQGELDVAIAGQQLDRADGLAAVIAEIDPENAELTSRMAGVGQMRELTARGQRQLAARQYMQAAGTFRTLLGIDAANRDARAGLASAVGALINAGMLAANSGDLETARDRLDQARRADPNASGISTLSDRIETVGSAPILSGPEELVAEARAAIDGGQVFGVDSGDAFAIIAAINRGWPGDPVVPELRRDARARPVELGRSAVASEDLAAMRRVVERADELGLDPALFGDLGDELSYRAYMADFESGGGRIWRISELTPTTQQSPELGRRAARLSGYTDVEFTIDREGRVIGAGILSSTSTAFEGPSLEAIQGWRFEPVVVGGRAVPAQSVMRFSFVN